MKAKEALALLETAPTGQSASALNKYLTQDQAIAIVRAAIKAYNPEKELNPVIELRVKQVVMNQFRPIY